MIQDPKIWPLVPVCTCHQHQAEDLITGTRSARPLKGLAWLMVKMDLTLGMLMIERCYNLSMYMIEREREMIDHLCVYVVTNCSGQPQSVAVSLSRSQPQRVAVSLPRSQPQRVAVSLSQSPTPRKGPWELGVVCTKSWGLVYD